MTVNIGLNSNRIIKKMCDLKWGEIGIIKEDNQHGILVQRCEEQLMGGTKFSFHIVGGGEISYLISTNSTLVEILTSGDTIVIV